MAVAKKPVPPVTKKQVVAPRRATAPAKISPEELEELEEDVEEEAAAPKSGWKQQARQPQPPQEQAPREKMTGFPEGSLFEQDGDGAVIFAGTFHPDELHALIEEARQNSTDAEKVRIKVFKVDDQYQKGPRRRVRINFSGLQPRTQQSGYGQKKSWGGGNKRW